MIRFVLETKGGKIGLIIRASLAAMVFLASMETAARVDDFIKYRAPLFGKYTADRLRARDQDGIRHNIANRCFEKWRINANGFRGPEISIAKHHQVRRIICMGASETFGLYERPGHEWPAQLAGLLQASGRYEVINAAVVGLDLRDYRSYLSKYVLKFQPDVIIVMVNPYAYAAGRHRPADASSHGISPAGPAMQASGIPYPLISGIGAIGDLRLVPKIKQVVKQVIPHSLLAGYQVWNMKRQVLAIEKRRLAGRAPMDEVQSRDIDIFEQDLGTLVAYLTEQGIEPVLCSYPALIADDTLRMYPAVFYDHRRFYIELSFKGLIDATVRFNRIIKETADKYGTTFVDLYQAVPKDDAHFGDNVHYTDQGARLVAVEIQRHLQRMLSSRNASGGHSE